MTYQNDNMPIFSEGNMKLLINLISIYRKFIDRSLMNEGVRIQGTIKSFLYGVLQFPLPIYAKLITKYK